VKYVGKFSFLKEIQLSIIDIHIKNMFILLSKVKQNLSQVIGLVFNMMSQLENTMERMYYIYIDSNKKIFDI
jgi:hypothetical protein